MEPKQSLTCTSTESQLLYRVPRREEVAQPHYTSWFAAMTFLNQYSTYDARTWREISLPLQIELAALNPKDKDSALKRAALLYQFLLGESKKPENHKIEFPMGSSGSRSFIGSIEFRYLQAEARKYREVCLGLREDAIYLHAIQFGLTPSRWTPHKDSSKLRSRLIKSGPMIVFGRFAESCYKEEPTEQPSRFLGERVFGWKPGAERAAQQLTSAIVVIGAWVMGEKSRVFFINPQVSPHPSRVYVISYGNLTSNITTVGARLPEKVPGVTYREESMSTYGFHSDSIQLER